MGEVYRIAICVIIIFAGILIFFDYRGITSAWRAGTQEWWQRGQLGQDPNVRVPSFKFIGAALSICGLAALIGSIVWAA
jgi:hypothetical protein